MFWTATRGDRLSQTYLSTEPLSATHLELDLEIASNNLTPGQQVDWDVLVNDVLGRSWSRTSAEGTGALHLEYDVAPIAGAGMGGDDWTLLMRVKLLLGLGAVAIGSRSLIRRRPR